MRHGARSSDGGSCPGHRAPWHLWPRNKYDPMAGCASRKKKLWARNLEPTFRGMMPVWAELCAPKGSHIEVSTPSTLERDLIWRKGLDRANQVKTRPLVWALVHYDRCPCKKRRYGHKRHTWREEDVMRHREKTANYKPRRGT